MPALGADMEFGTIIEWLVKPGDAIKRGDIIAVVDTEKATIEVEVFQTGILEKILVPEGEKVPIGTPLALIKTEGEAVQPPAPPAAAPKPTAPEAPPILRPPPAPPRVERPAALEIPAHEPGRIQVSPLARRIAADLKVDLAHVKGTGPGGVISKSDVEQAAAAQVAAKPAPGTPGLGVPPERPAARPAARPTMTPQERHAAMRKVIAAAMARSKRETPHYYLGAHVDMSRAMAWLREENLKRTVNERLLYVVMLLKAVARAVHEVPETNGFWIEGAFKQSDAIHVGVAISLRGGGLIAPAIHDVDRKSLDEIMAALRDLVNRVRAGVLRSSEIADATITVTNLGEQGVETVYGVIYPPQVALVGFGKIVERPWSENGMIGSRPIMSATLAGDHRASDGHRGGLFLSAIERHLQEPQKL